MGRILLRDTCVGNYVSRSHEPFRIQPRKQNLVGRPRMAEPLSSSRIHRLNRLVSCIRRTALHGKAVYKGAGIPAKVCRK